MALTVYTLSQCSTCRAATKWLTQKGIRFQERPIRETPPSASELRTMLAAYDGNLRRLFNTSGMEYRAQKLGERIDTLAPEEAIALLARNGSLVRRPFLIGEGKALIGFKPAEWAAALR